MRDPNRPRVIPREPVPERKEPEPTIKEDPPKIADGKVPFTRPDGTVIYGTPKQVGHWNKMKRGIRRRVEE